MYITERLIRTSELKFTSTQLRVPSGTEIEMGGKMYCVCLKPNCGN
jgi:hypothetical protein